MSLSPDAAGFEKWADVAETEWAEDRERQLMQIDALAQKYAQVTWTWWPAHHALSHHHPTN